LVFGCDVSSVFRCLRLNSTRSTQLFNQNCTSKRATLSSSEALYWIAWTWHFAPATYRKSFPY
jgi:hypothetical protein